MAIVEYTVQEGNETVVYRVEEPDMGGGTVDATTGLSSEVPGALTTSSAGEFVGEGLWNFASGMGRGAAQTTALAGDILTYPLRKAVEWGTGKKMQTMSEMMSQDMEREALRVGGYGLQEKDSWMQRIGEFAVPVGAQAKGAQMASGALGGLVSKAVEKVAPENATAQVVAPLAAMLTPAGIKAAGRKIAPSAATRAAKVAEEIGEVAPGALAKEGTVGEKITGITENIEKKGVQAAKDAGDEFKALPKEKVYLDDAINNIAKKAEELEGPLDPSGASYSFVNYLKRMQSKDEVKEVFDYATGKMKKIVYPAEKTVEELPNVQTMVSNAGALLDTSKRVNRVLMKTAKEELKNAVKQSVQPDTYKAWEKARDGWKTMKETFEEGAIRKVRKIGTTEEGNLLTLQKKLLSDPKSTKQLVRVMDAEDLKNAQSLVLEKLFEAEPKTWEEFIIKKKDSFNSLFGEIGTQRLVDSVSKDGTVGKLLIKDDDAAVRVVARIARPLGGAALGYGESESLSGAIAGAALGFGANRFVSSRLNQAQKAKMLLLKAAAGDQQVVNLLNTPVNKIGMPELTKALHGTLLGQIASDGSYKFGDVDLVSDAYANTTGSTQKKTLVNEDMVSESFTPSKTNERIATNISSAAEAEGVNPKLIDALIQVESNGQPNAVGKMTKYGTAKGLMQILDSTASELAAKTGRENYSLFDIDDNLALGTRYVRELIDKYNGDVKLALTAYHTGMGLVDKYLREEDGETFEDIEHRLGKEGKQYAKKVLNKFEA